jgi:hypothetical protein
MKPSGGNNNLGQFFSKSNLETLLQKSSVPNQSGNANESQMSHLSMGEHSPFKNLRLVVSEKEEID